MNTPTQKYWLITVSCLIFGVAVSATGIAQEGNQEGNQETNLEAGYPSSNAEEIDIITVTGTRNINDIPGSVSFISKADLALQNYTDINRVLRTVPGVNLQEEDGYGLFPNIGIRGSGTDKSSKVLLLEDGIPIAPAPFSAPSAYYFQAVARMNAGEVSKSVGAVKYGPITTAGSIQFFSTPLPKNAAAHITALTSSLDRTNIHAYAGKRFETKNLPFDVGVLLETYQDKADGFKQIDIGSTGFTLSDYVGKLGFYSKAGAVRPQSLLLKFQYSKGNADETYLGLTQEDFARAPLMRYRASQLDNITTEHKTYQATHTIKFSNNVKLTTLAYRTEFARNWEKLDRFDNSALSGLAACNSLNEILIDPQTCAQEYQVLLGPDAYTSPDDVLGIRQNNRAYFAKGLQSALGIEFNTGGLDHNLVASVRYHEDGVDRFQEQDQYRIEGGFVIKTTDNAPGTQANRLSNAKSIAVFAEDTVTVGDWAVTGGLRFEKITTDQVRWPTPDRSLPPSSIRENAFNVWLPSLGVTYDISDDLSLLAGVSRGFSPPGPANRTAAPERSVSYEFGGRYNSGYLSFEAIGFFNDYSNLLAQCTNSSGGSECDIGDADNAGAADVYGLELTANTDLGRNIDGISIPVSLAYTYTDTKLLSSVDSDIYGNVMAGDEIPYVPKNQITLSGGVHGDVWGLNASLNHIGETRDVPGQGPIPTTERVDGRTLVDVAAYYDIKDGVRLHLKADNIFDTLYLAGRRPYGIRPGKPREIFAGISFDF